MAHLKTWFPDRDTIERWYHEDAKPTYGVMSSQVNRLLSSETRLEKVGSWRSPFQVVSYPSVTPCSSLPPLPVHDEVSHFVPLHAAHHDALPPHTWSQRQQQSQVTTV